MQSEQVNDIAAAMVAVQAETGPALKTAANPFFKSKYADLSEVWAACHEALSKHGIAVIQGSRLVDGFPCMETKLLHTSGQWLSSLWQMTPAKPDPQAMGSAITYMRRYSLAAMVGIVTADDDGEGAMGRAPAAMEDNRQKADAQAAKQVGKYIEGQGPALIPVQDIEDTKVRWKNWREKFEGAIRKATSPEEVTQWWEANSAPLGNFKRAYAVSYDKTHAFCEHRKQELNEKAGLGPTGAG